MRQPKLLIAMRTFLVGLAGGSNPKSRRSNGARPGATRICRVMVERHHHAAAAAREVREPGVSHEGRACRAGQGNRHRHRQARQRGHARKTSMAPTSGSGGSAAGRTGGRRSSMIRRTGAFLPDAGGAEKAGRAGASGQENGGLRRRLLQRPGGIEICTRAASSAPRCRAFPPATTTIIEIVQTPGYVAIYQEQMHETRIIPLDGRAHLDPGVRQWLGDSRGHWEGNTLVVETTNFSDQASFEGATKNMRLVERWTRVADDRIDYRFTVE